MSEELPFKMICKTETEQYRRDTFWTKEPETLRWIESFPKGAVFYDVGANVGLYSLYAAQLGQCKAIYAFEPDLLNFIRLVANARLNRYLNVRPVYRAFSDQCRLAPFFVRKVEAGASGGQIDAPRGEDGQEFQPQQVNYVEVDRLDRWACVHDCLMPTHIKIDVDGAERRILTGMVELLWRKQLASLLVEINHDGDRKLFDHWMELHGFRLSPLNDLPDHSRVRRKAEGIKAENVIYCR